MLRKIILSDNRPNSILRSKALSYIWTMKIALVLLIGLVPFLAFSQSSSVNDERIDEAKSEYRLISNEDFEYLDCSQTVNGRKMKEFFQEYPEYGSSVKVISIPNCYGEPGEKFFVLLYEEDRDFQVPNYVRGSVKP